MPKRKSLRKFLLLTTAVLLLLCLSFYGYIRYQVYTSYQTGIHKEAKALIRVDVYAIYRSMFRDYLSRKKTDKESLFEGISIPANIFIYTVKDKQPTTLFAALPIADVAALQQSLKVQGRWIPSKNAPAGITIVSTADKTWTIVYNTRRIAFAYSLQKENVQDILLEIVQEKNTIPVAQSMFKTIQEQKGHATFLAGANSGNLYFHKGNIQASFTLSAKGYSIPIAMARQQAEKETVLNLWLYADLKPLLQGKTYQVDSLLIHGDSLLAFHPKGFELTITKPVVQREEVVTYAYNDDFEKVATTTVQEHTVPGLYFRLKTDIQPLSSYLKRGNIIDKDSGRVQKSLFPLYQLYATADKEYLQVSTVPHLLPEKEEITAPDFFGLQVDFEKLQQQQDFAIIQKYVKPFRQLQSRAALDKMQTIHLEATLYFNDSVTNALLQLLDL